MKGFLFQILECQRSWVREVFWCRFISERGWWSFLMSLENVTVLRLLKVSIICVVHKQIKRLRWFSIGVSLLLLFGFDRTSFRNSNWTGHPPYDGWWLDAVWMGRLSGFRPDAGRFGRHRHLLRRDRAEKKFNPRVPHGRPQHEHVSRVHVADCLFHECHHPVRDAGRSLPIRNSVRGHGVLLLPCNAGRQLPVHAHFLPNARYFGLRSEYRSLTRHTSQSWRSVDFFSVLRATLP